VVITIDGPAGSGKSTVARTLAERLNSYYLYTGLLYRAAAYALCHAYGDEFVGSGRAGSFKIGDQDCILFEQLSYDYINKNPHVTYQNHDITDIVQRQKYDQLASIVSANKSVRDALLTLQREVGKAYDIIADGRDCGTIVFPDAQYKFYLTASLDVRASRLFQSAKRKGAVESLEEMKQELDERDKRDMNREVAPLRVPKNAIVIDNSDLTSTQTIALFVEKLSLTQ